MDEDFTERERVAKLTLEAERDLQEIYEYSAIHWGKEQAERYHDFLGDAIQAICSGEVIGRPIQGSSTLLGHFVKWPKARYGHVIVHTAAPKVILVVRVYHSSRDFAIFEEDI